MNPDDYQELQSHFLELRELKPREREERLAALSDGVAVELRSLLHSDEACDDFLEPAERETELATTGEPAAESLLRQVDNYRLLQKIGEGGFGSVYLAEQKQPIQRRVAIKLIKPGMDSSQVLARFHAERQALAMMDHESIARVFDAGTTAAGTPFFAMELVKGEPIDQFCSKHELDLDARLRLFLQVCRAVHHAHQKGVIHRDIKPSNVLVTMHDQQPLVKIIDFGIAKALDSRLTEQTLFTEQGQMLGTLEYMSPEQADMKELNIDTRSDVYSLGVVFYQLLTGETPIKKESLLRHGIAELAKQLKETEPRTPSLLHADSKAISQADSSSTGVQSLPSGDLDWIALKALAREPRHRYDSARDFARDIECFLQGSAVDAHPPSFAYRAQKFVRKNQLLVFATTVIAVGLLIGVAGLVIGFREADQAITIANQQRDQARDASNQLAKSMYSELLRSAWRAGKTGDTDRANHLLGACAEDLRGWEWQFAKSQIENRPRTELRDAGQSSLLQLSVHEESGLVAGVTQDGKVEVWTLAGRLLHEIDVPQRANVVRFSPTGRSLFVGLVEGLVSKFRVSDASALSSVSLSIGGIYDITVTDDGRKVALCSGASRVQILDAETLELLHEWKLNARMANLVFSQDGQRLVAAGMDGMLYSFSLADDSFEHNLISTTNLHELQRLGDSAVATVSGSKVVEVSALADATAPQILFQAGSFVSAMDFSLGMLAIGEGDGRLTLFDMKRKRTVDQLELGHAVTTVRQLERDGSLLVCLSDGRMLSIQSDVSDLGWSPIKDCRLIDAEILEVSNEILTLEQNGWLRVRLRNGKVLSERKAHNAATWAVTADQQGTRAATIGEDGWIRCWSLPKLDLIFEAEHSWGVRDICFSPDGSWIAAAPAANMDSSREGDIGIWNVGTGECEYKLEGHDNWVLEFEVNRSGSQLVSGGENRTIRIWDMKTREQQFLLAPEKTSVATQFSFAPDDQHLFVGHRDGLVTTWSLRDGSVQKTWPAFGDAISGLCALADGRVLASCRSARSLKVHHATTERMLAEFDLGIGYLTGFELSDDGNTLVLQNDKGRLFVR